MEKPKYILTYKGVASTPDYLIKEDKGTDTYTKPNGVICRFEPTTAKTADDIRAKANLVLNSLNYHDELVQKLEALANWVSLNSDAMPAALLNARMLLSEIEIIVKK